MLRKSLRLSLIFVLPLIAALALSSLVLAYLSGKPRPPCGGEDRGGRGQDSLAPSPLPASEVT